MVSDERSAGFTRFILRTMDVEAASAFYDEVVGSRGDGIVPLHESALARGARPHWLGQIQVAHLGGVEAVAAAFVERGATRLGPPPGVADFVILRDPGGAIVAVTEGEARSSAGVVWHQLNTREPGVAAANYTDLFGWTYAVEELDMGRSGRHRPFAFGAGQPFVGVISGIEGRPEVHPHWLFYFGIPSLEIGLERVTTLGGVVAGRFELPDGERIAVCEDPQGAAFGLLETADAARLARE
jgi:predicted enzyme related to lactoylglutathione lyase